MSTPERQPDVMNQGLMEHARNFHDGALAKLAVAAAFVGGTTATGMAVNPHPVSADTAPATVLTPEEKQQCIDDALAKPEITRKLVMYNAGISGRQITRGAITYPELPEGCAPTYIRTGGGRQQIKHGNRWVTTIQNATGILGNQEGSATLSFIPNHDWATFAFSSCVDGHFEKSRVIVDEYLKIADDSGQRQVGGHKRYIIPIKVNGNCEAAIRSRKKAQKLAP